MESGEACSTQRGSGRRTKTSSHPYLPLPPVRPCPCPFPRSRRLFSGRPGFLCDGVVEERRKRGGWERKRQTDGEVDRDEVMAQCSQWRRELLFPAVEVPGISLTGRHCHNRQIKTQCIAHEVEIFKSCQGSSNQVPVVNLGMPSSSHGIQQRYNLKMRTT